MSPATASAAVTPAQAQGHCALSTVTAPAPRDFTPGAGLPGDRSAHRAARLAFATLKVTYLQALDTLPATEWLRVQVCSAEEPVDLWLLRAPAFAALAGVSADCRSRRQMLRRGLDSMFPDLDTPSGYMPLL